MRRVRKKPMSDTERLDAYQFKLNVCRGASCVRCGRSEEDCAYAGTSLQAAHVIPKQTLRRTGLADHIWNPLNGMALCTDCHAEHDTYKHRVDAPESAYEFAEALGMGWYMEKHYRKEAA